MKSNIVLLIVIALVVSLLPIWRIAGQGRYNAWEAMAHALRSGTKHISREEAIDEAAEAFALSPAGS